MKCMSPETNKNALFAPEFPEFKLSFYTQAENIKAVLSDGGIVQGIEMTGRGQWKKLIPEKVAMSYFTQEAERMGMNKTKLGINQISFLRFSENTDGIRQAKKQAIDCRNLVFVHFYENYMAIIQGVEIDMKSQKGFTTTKLSPTRLVAPGCNYMSNGYNYIPIEYDPAYLWIVSGVAASYAPLTSLTAADFEAL